ncbi:transmembrane protein 39A [Colias croceus]|uniref:transmembrane protein 39A n=1 Tax=Colias crocea TaxID=72248 RepID=UPI001E280715|nr:transmembrane protein 39A [Colias croceus]
MSCDEDESGTFVVFFLPTVLGCLTILLARRWAYSQVSNTSSTAISRRRKIIKDPLIKRHLPQVTTKMVAPKKLSGTTKKGTPVLDEDSSNGKRVRSRLPSNTPVPEVKLPEGPSPPKHIPFPFIPLDGELLFEIMTFIFLAVATGLQFLNLYRTAWWLPTSYTTQAMHFHLVDPHVVMFIMGIISPRMLLCASVAIVRLFVAPKMMPHATTAARMFILGAIIGMLGWSTYYLLMKYPLVKMVYLVYPSIIYFILFGFHLDAFLELNHTETLPMHSCSHDPEQIRSEVEMLKEDFNLRVKKILFHSIIGAYYTSFVPCCFAQPFLYYDVLSAAQQVGLVWGALCGRYAAQMLPALFCDVPHRATKHLGSWKLEGPATSETNDVPQWSGSKFWSQGSRVRCDDQIYIADTPTVAADPTNMAHVRFYTVFNNPSKLMCLLVCLQLALVLLKLCLLFSSIVWHYFLSIVVLLFINYYSLYKMLRDYLVAWKVYKAENLIQDKNVQAN